MSLAVFLAVLCAAALHATWNALIKFGGDKLQGMFLLSLGHGILALGMIAYFPAPDPASYGWLAASVAFHLFYKTMLTLAYQRGDLSRVYPIARGTAPLLVVIISLMFLADPLTTFAVVGVALVSFGILMMARGVFTSGENRSLLPFALLSAVGTMGYSIADGLGARASGDPSGYVGWLFLLDAMIFMIVAMFIRGRSIWKIQTRDWVSGLLAGVLSVLAYWIAVWAMTKAPIAMVTALRETSVLFAVCIGVVFLGEKFDRTKLLAALFIAAGVIAMRL